MTSLYTKSSHSIPEGFTKPTSSFRKHVWLSILGILLFIIVYLTLIIWFGRLTYYSFAYGSSFWYFLLGIGYGFLCLFMIKGLFIFTKREKSPLDRYVTKEEEPVLFEYLYQLADEAGAPRPAKVFLSPRVNASVSYDLSIINLIIPSKKNLEIGLGLMNVLSLGELKAVLAHEFGHFAQRSMLLGRYVYIAQQIAVQIIVKRDILDKFLAGISSFDLRIAWVGWLLSILVWAIRSLIETIFNVVTMAQRALSREMEFQADLVAVSLTGSDALIHALHKLQAADEAYEHSITAINTKLSDKKAIHNLYKLQTNYIKKMSWMLNDPDYGKSPKVNVNDSSSHRVFGKRAYNPPQMWATHPADTDREENAKRKYIFAEIDERPAEHLLSDSRKYEIEMTAALIATAGVETEILTDEESLEFQNKKFFSWTFQDPKYNSNFLNRYFTINFENVEQMYSANVYESELTSNFRDLYSNKIKEKLENLKEVKDEIASLKTILHEVITIEKREIWHRGNKIKRKDIKSVIENLEHEEVSITLELNKHDTLCRSTHYKAASIQNFGTANYLKSLSKLVHYSEHTISDITDASYKYHNVVTIALADGNVSSSELTDILSAGFDFYKSIKYAFIESQNIILDKELLENSDKESYAEFFEEFKLDAPTSDNINNWSKVVDGWADVALKGLNFLRNSSLEHLLKNENIVRDAFLNNTPIHKVEYGENNVSETYNLLTPGKERPIQRKLKLWDQFMIGEGLFGATAKFLVSFVLLGGALFFGNISQYGSLTIFNGLDFNVIVDIEGVGEIKVIANSFETISVDCDETYNIVTSKTNGVEIEKFEGKIGSPKLSYIYNIANAGVFYEYTAYYSNLAESWPENRNIGASRWFESKADYILVEPPLQDDIGTKKDVLVGISNVYPYDMFTVVNDSLEWQKMITTHVIWDSPHNEYILTWISLLSYTNNISTVIDKRIVNYGKDMIAQRAKMDFAGDDEKIKICAKINEEYEQNPEDPDTYYLSIRCMEDSDYQDSCFISGFEKWSNHSWLAYAAGYVYAQNEEWDKSLQAFNIASNINSLKEVIALDAEKVRRMANTSFKEGMLSFTTPNLDYYLKIDHGLLNKSSGDASYVYVLISKGNLREADEFIEQNADFKPYILRYLAVSEGASQSIKNKVKFLPKTAGINESTIWYSLAFDILEGKDYSSTIAEIEAKGVIAKDLNDFIDFTLSGKYENAEEIIKQQSIFVKGHMYAFGIIISKFQTPDKWKDITYDLLFAHERPFLGY